MFDQCFKQSFRCIRHHRQHGRSSNGPQDIDAYQFDTFDKIYVVFGNGQIRLATTLATVATLRRGLLHPHHMGRVDMEKQPFPTRPTFLTGGRSDQSIAQQCFKNDSSGFHVNASGRHAQDRHPIPKHVHTRQRHGVVQGNDVLGIQDQR